MTSNPTRSLIIDDEPGARAIIRNYLYQSFPEIQVLGEASGMQEGLSLIQQAEFDLLFLDIEMQDGTGFDLLDRVPKLNFKVIFTTAHDEFAIRAFRYNAIHYLLKPIDQEDFIQAVTKALEHTKAEDLQRQLTQLINTTQQRTFDRITLTTGSGPVFAETKDIKRIETYGNYAFVYLTEGDRLLVSRNLKEFEEMLPEPDFFRIHQSHIINTSFVKKVIKDDHGEHALMDDGTEIPISRRRKEEFLHLMNRKS